MPALCGARGCVIGCMKNMERKKTVKNLFRVNPVFSKKKPWALPERPEKRDHQGFVFNPEKEASAGAHEAASNWY